MRTTNASRTILIVAFVTLMFLVLGCSRSPDQLFESAKERESKGDRAGAILDLKAAIQGRPDDGSMRFVLGRLYNHYFDGLPAEKELRKAQELGAVEGGRVAAELAFALRNQRKYQQLLDEIEPVSVFETEQQAIIHSLRGQAQLMLRQIPQARVSYADAHRISPDIPETHMLAANLKLLDGHLKEAVELVEGVVAKSPERYDAKLILASFYKDQGKLDEALALYGEILKSIPQHYRALVDRSTVLVLRGRFQDAHKDVNVLIKAYRSYPQPFIQRAFVQLTSGKPKDALESALIALKAKPEPPQALLMAGLAYHALKQPLQAEAVLTRLVAQVPGSLVGRRALADVLISLNSARRALEVLEPVLRFQGGDARAFAIAGQGHALLGDFAAAQSWYERAALLAPQDSKIHVGLSLVRLDAGDFDRGTAELTKALELAKEATAIDEILVLTLLRRNKVDEAAIAVDALEKRAPKSPISTNLKGLVLLAKNERSSAVQLFEAALKQDPRFFPAAQNLAQLDVQEGKLDRALSRFEGVLASDQENLSALLAKAELFLRMDKVREAGEVLERATSAHPASIEAGERLVSFHVRSGSMAKALEAAERLVRDNADSPEALVLSGRAQLAVGNSGQAIQTFSRLLRISPRQEAFLLLARAQSAESDHSGAERTLRKALEVRHNSLDVQLALASLLASQGRIDQALQLARDAKKRQPESPNGYLVEGALYEKQGKLKEGLATYKVGIAESDSDELVVRAFQLEQRVGDRAAAVPLLQKWLEARPKNVNVRRLLGAALVEKEDYKGAVEVYERLADLAPNDADILNGLAWVYHKQRDPRARKTAESAYALNPQYAYAAGTLGWILVKDGEVKRGLELLKYAHERLPGHASIKYRFAYALNLAGEKEAARRLLREALSEQFADRQDAEKLYASIR